MAIAYTWDCKTVDVFPTKDDKVNVVHSVHWKYTGTENEYSRTLIGTVRIDTEDLSSFTEFVDLTNGIISSWVESELGSEKIADFQAQIENQISELKNPTSITKQIED